MTHTHSAQREPDLVVAARQVSEQATRRTLLLGAGLSALGVATMAALLAGYGWADLLGAAVTLFAASAAIAVVGNKKATRARRVLQLWEGSATERDPEEESLISHLRAIRAAAPAESRAPEIARLALLRSAEWSRLQRRLVTADQIDGALRESLGSERNLQPRLAELRQHLAQRVLEVAAAMTALADDPSRSDRADRLESLLQ